ncbi:MBL fold metallo-hydrolase [Rossellomorea aquimaris]|uniref:MBL fold metallo-hydrolase n=1 Tax=Rossellomorea aquimaris TaxID=189382 RepID=UPI001CD4ABDC|nr:MBL fold metallo-hydrolase [Rossellomorea aquimaris]MCA1053677.1 MBL fold metallo-hydrolase [Rossellomorea aquimaris]
MIKTFKLVRRVAGLKMHVYITQVDDILIDTGPYSLHKQVRSLVEDTAFKRVILTHHHEDHTGNCAWIEDQLGIPQWIHQKGVSECKVNSTLPLYRSIFWRNRKSFQPYELRSEEMVYSNEHSLKVVHTPGHADDHIVLIDEENGFCLTGDLYLFHSPTSHFSFESVPELIRSLQITLKHSFKGIYCSHGGYFPNGRRLLERKRDYLENLQHEVMTQYKSGHSPREIRKILFPENKPFHYLSLFENSPQHTINSIIQST